MTDRIVLVEKLIWGNIAPSFNRCFRPSLLSNLLMISTAISLITPLFPYIFTHMEEEMKHQTPSSISLLLRKNRTRMRVRLPLRIRVYFIAENLTLKKPFPFSIHSQQGCDILQPLYLQQCHILNHKGHKGRVGTDKNLQNISSNRI
ncbi:unnamed protein product [Onchocerca flexuosa]|uniref:Ovule protein n=1 Tax=Onchocerca flexuosa TaxID=387005 RepID=A0A183H9U3_9BILA|nr:unnamed protein product [Onchocerca flexuosa]